MYNQTLTMTGSLFAVVLFDSVSHAMKAEKILKIRAIPHKIIPVPKEMSSDCGVCIRFERAAADSVQQALSGQADSGEIRML